MQATRLIAIRHGETDWNALGRIQGKTDIGLNPRGRRQAELLAQALADEPIDAVYSSDLARALDTARALAERAGAPLVADAGLRERGFGAFEGMTFAAIEARWPEGARRWRARDERFGPDGGGEVLADFYRRSVERVEAIGARHFGATIAVVAHGGVLDCLYRAATRIALDAPRTWRLGNASINRLLYTPQGLTLVGWADTRHLDDAADAASSDALGLPPSGPGATGPDRRA